MGLSLVEPFRKAAEEGDIEECGRLLDKNWELKQRMASGITNPRIMEMYDKAKAAGALGGKIAGAGGGKAYTIGDFAEIVREVSADCAD